MMLKRLCFAAIALTALALIHSNAAAKVLSIGDLAPAITVKKFVKGAPVVKFQKGKLYVVELWATWCAPCKKSIPHLTELQKKYPDVTFIGVSIWEDSQAKVEPFVKAMGEKMNYRVAMDAVPAGKDGHSGVMAATWLDAAKQDGIPTAFIIGKDGRLAWIGHPMDLAEPIAKVVAGKWDVKTAAVAAAHIQEVQAKLGDLKMKVAPLMAKKDYAGVLAIVDTSIAAVPDLEAAIGGFKFSLLMNLGKDADAMAYGTKLVGGLLSSRADDLNQFAWILTNPPNPKPTPPIAELALKAAARADELSKGTNADIADTLATAYFASGKKDLAISTEERAIKNSTDPEVTAELKKSLEKFKK
jgi:thiol-disulfide isomerase/thioredoxin